MCLEHFQHLWELDKSAKWDRAEPHCATPHVHTRGPGLLGPRAETEDGYSWKGDNQEILTSARPEIVLSAKQQLLEVEEERNETEQNRQHVTPSTLERQAREGTCSSFAPNPTFQESLGRLDHLSVELRRQVSHGTEAQQSLHSL